MEGIGDVEPGPGRETPAAESSVPGKDPPTFDAVDEVIAESFPASDPPQWWAGPPG
jgi:hypothetical protein